MPTPAQIATRRVTALRKRHGITAQQLADAAPIPVSAVFNAEREASKRVYTVDELWRLARVLDVPVAALVAPHPGDGPLTLDADDDPDTEVLQPLDALRAWAVGEPMFELAGEVRAEFGAELLPQVAGVVARIEAADLEGDDEVKARAAEVLEEWGSRWAAWLGLDDRATRDRVLASLGEVGDLVTALEEVLADGEA